MNEVMSLTIEADAVRLVGGAAGADGQVIAPGIAALVAGDLGRPASLAWRIEAAIATIEDVLATVPSGLHHAAVSSRAPAIRESAGLAGVDSGDRHGAALTREAVEQVFNRLAAVAEGRPASVEGLPESTAFIAALLVIRELMHHLDVPVIALAR